MDLPETTSAHASTWIDAGKRLFGRTDFRPELERVAAAKAELFFKRNKKAREYANVLNGLPDIRPSRIHADHDRIIIGTEDDLDGDQKNQLLQGLKQLIPWRKGPFELFGTVIESEWNSALKWNRLKDRIAPLSGRRILDVGCSNGYYLFRMAANRPESILGIEPYPTFFAQFLLLQNFIQEKHIFCLPAKLEDIHFCRSFFDTVFCMGILYHQRSPLDALRRIHALMRSEGELVLETIILPGDGEAVLSPVKRYAIMNNVHFIPTIASLHRWLEQTGFVNIRTISIAKTTLMEQRRTDWIASLSLDAFLDPANPDLTIEGYPAPTRAIVLADAGSLKQQGNGSLAKNLFENKQVF